MIAGHARDGNPPGETLFQLVESICKRKFRVVRTLCSGSVAIRDSRKSGLNQIASVASGSAGVLYCRPGPVRKKHIAPRRVVTATTIRKGV